MGGRRLTVSTLALTLSLVGAHAADYPQPTYYQPQPIIIQQPVHDFTEGWYLRGDVGVAMIQKYNLEYLRNPLNINNFVMESTSNSDAWFIGAGVGYEWNNWLRFDVTGEYRSKASFEAMGSYTFGGGTFLDVYHGYLQSWVFLANAYVDLGTWNCFTPFVGAGIGAARNSIIGLTDIGVPTAGRGFGRDSSEWHLAWALHAGVAYNVNKNFKVELAYRYLNYGSITELIDCVGGCNPDSYRIGKLSSHDIKLGFRWTCCEAPTPPPPTYIPPPPPYVPPPIRSKG